ncbi:MAG: Rne/Rng family ribonuclease [Candidatus Acetothermia bacterium]
MKQILISSKDKEQHGEKRIAILEDGKLVEIFYEDFQQDKLVGNIYKGRVEDILSGLGSAFVDVGEEQSLFLSRSEINQAILRSRGFNPKEYPPRIDKVINEGESLIVQVKRGGIGSKNPQGTTKVSLPGRYWVFLPKDSRLGISRRITDDREIQRLKDVARNLKEENEGLIARTASKNASKEDLKRDFNFLLGTWKGVEEEANNVKAPHLLHSHAGMVRTVIRDRLLEDVDEVLTNSKPVYEDIIDYLHYLRMDNFQDVVRHYQQDTPMFKHYGVEKQLEKCLQREVSLDSGGYLAIDETEALTAIDVNTGGNVNHKNQAQAILNTNLSAAREIPIQLRLRKISGIIIVDFVDMYDNEDQQKVIDKLKKSLREDRVPADFIDMTPLGLVEITRKREGESLADLMEGYHDEE